MKLFYENGSFYFLSTKILSLTKNWYPERIRTYDLLCPSRTLYPVHYENSAFAAKKSYISFNSFFAYQKLIPRAGSILRSSVCESDALAITPRKQWLRRQKLPWYIPSLKKCIFLNHLLIYQVFQKTGFYTLPPRSRKTGIATWNRKTGIYTLPPPIT